MNLESVIQNEVSQKEKKNNNKKNGTDKPIRRAGIETWTHRKQPADTTGEGEGKTD